MSYFEKVSDECGFNTKNTDIKSINSIVVLFFEII